MYRVTWTDHTGKPASFEADQSDCRQLLFIIGRAVIRGQASDALLLDPDGNVIDSWGT